MPPQSVQGQDTYAGHVWVARSAPSGAEGRGAGGDNLAPPSVSGRSRQGDDAPAGAASLRDDVYVVFVAAEGIGRIVIGDKGKGEADDSGDGEIAGSKKRRVGAASGVLSMLVVCGCAGVGRGAGQRGGRGETGLLGTVAWGTSSGEWDWAGDVRVSTKTVTMDFPWTFM